MCSSAAGISASSAPTAPTSWRTFCSRSPFRPSSTPRPPWRRPCSSIRGSGTAGGDPEITLHPGIGDPHHQQDRPLHNPADRDHCLQYMTAVALIFGELTADHYRRRRRRPAHRRLRKKMKAVEDPRYSRDYLDPDKALHRQRRAGVFPRRQLHGKGGGGISSRSPPSPDEGLPLLMEKFEENLASRFPPAGPGHPGPLP